MEPINPSVWRRASRNTALSVRAVRIANGEYQGCPPRVVRGAACQAAIASSVNQTVKLPRWRKPASYAAQLVTLRFCLGIWWRRAALALNGMAGSGSEQACILSRPNPRPARRAARIDGFFARGRKRGLTAGAGGGGATDVSPPRDSPRPRR